MGTAYSWIRAVAWAKGHWYHAATTASVLGLTGSFSVGMACGIFRKCDSDPCGTPMNKDFFDKPACNYWEHGGDNMLPMRKRDSSGTTVTVINGMKRWGRSNQGDYGHDEVPGVTIYSSNNVGEGGGALDVFGEEEELAVTVPGTTVPDWIYITNAGEMPLCMAGVRLTAPDGSEITMTGNLGRICGADHYESALTVLPNAQGKAASCVWIDRQGSNGIRLPGISFNLQTDEKDLDFYTITSVEDLCRAPFIMLQDDQPSSPLSRRQLIAPTFSRDDSITPNLDFDSALVKSSLNLSSAVQMCQSESAKGPHFVSLSEGVYCDMFTRELYPVCQNGIGGREEREICFDPEQDELVERDRDEDGLPSRPRRRFVERDQGSSRPRRVKVLKTFRHVDTWN
ncbi:hypothetical protein AYO20_02723 [Fonsecaea nubica]|uniref:Uncharacterized protein n=1 Tax=Fonsecaea nubica TaxID=856822 RepID=A0A178D6P4_9EURO|nr:hypothetical protein AYO20_02723 [Fonsecaea nubica]OAL37890.1 hypothetical protein AYO20_02723 [Fonsecaea nubica]